jgi:hypothetical protein
MDLFEFDPGPSRGEFVNKAGFTYGVDSMERDWNCSAGRAPSISPLKCDHFNSWAGTEHPLFRLMDARAPERPASVFVERSGEDDLSRSASCGSLDLVPQA